MNTPAKLFVFGSPVPQPRPRCACLKIGATVRPTVREADSKHAIHRWRFAIVDAWRIEQPRFVGPVSVEIVFVTDRPKSETRKRGPNPAYWDTRRGDVDNYAKAVLDALNGKAWNDDSDVVELVVRKIVAGDGLEPGASILISTAPEVTDRFPVDVGTIPF